LSQFSLVPQDGLRKLFEAVEQGLQLAVLQGGGLVEGAASGASFTLTVFPLAL